MSPPESFAHVRAVAERVGFELSTAHLDALQRYAALLLRWNASINLTGARSLAEVFADHLPDAVALAGCVERGRSLLDVGSGGGLPGVPFALLRPDCAVALVEPRSRRTAFLRAAVQQLGLANASVAEARIELDECRPPLPLPQRVAAASSRATFPPADWLRCGAALVEPGGQLFAFLTEPPLASWGTAESVVRYEIGGGRARFLAVFRA